MSEIKKCKWGEFKVTENGIPEIEVITPDGDDYWLSAFRGYSFQVSDDDLGHGDRGATDVFGLGNLISAEMPDDDVDREWLYRSNLPKQGVTRYLISVAAYHAVMLFAMRRDIYPPTHKYDGFQADENWARFIDAVYIMITTGKLIKEDNKND